MREAGLEELLRRAREEAASALLALALGAESEETRRKACVDLLRLESPGGADEGEDDAPLDEEALRAFVEAFGAAAQRDEGDGGAAREASGS